MAVLAKKINSIFSLLGSNVTIRHYCGDDTIFYTTKGDFMVLTQLEAYLELGNMLKINTWTFKDDIIKYCLNGESDDVIKSFRDMVMGEECNAFLLSFINKTCGLDNLIQNIITDNNRGLYLSNYDGKEIIMENSLLAYRLI